MFSRHLLFALLLTLFSVIASPAASAAEEPRDRLFTTRVSVDATGKVTDVELMPEVPGLLGEMIRDIALDIPFEPATRDGVAVPSRTALQLRVRFTPQDGDYAVSLLDVRGGSYASVKMTAPRFPASALRSRKNMLAVLMLRPTPDGGIDREASQVESITFYDGTEPDPKATARLEREMRQALLAATSDWKYLLEEVDGQVITTEIRLPVTLCIGKRGGGKPSREVCDEWREAMSGELGRAQPVESGVRLAQPRLPAAPLPAA